MSTDELLGTTDAMVWAQEFCRLVREGCDATDEGWLVGWFANAMAVGERQGERTILDGEPPHLNLPCRDCLCGAGAPAIELCPRCHITCSGSHVPIVKGSRRDGF